MSFRALALLVTLAILPGCSPYDRGRGAAAGLGSPVNQASRASGALAAANLAKKNKPAADKFDRPKAEPNEMINAGLCFKLMDRNADGKLEAIEWPISAAAIAQGAPSFKDADADLDKAVTAYEWTSFARPRFYQAPYAQADIAGLFTEQDKDHGKKLTPEELSQFVKALPNATRDALYLETKSISEWMLGADKNHDYALDLAELEALIASLMLRRMGDVG